MTDSTAEKFAALDDAKSALERMKIGLFMKINSNIKVKYIGEDNPLALRYGKEYDARILKKGWYGIVDETNEEYAYPPDLFEIVNQ